jgi:poly-gamma-glutamate capsule biosynthesis protein CapA/YwtB (metallophosphatase superfamily)
MVRARQDALTLVAVGDVIVARKDYQQSFAKVADILKAADIAFFNCETPYAESGSPGMAQHGAMAHDPRGMPALLTAGFDVCTLANNHTLDWGVDAVVECRERLEAMGIAVCGAGRNINEARKPAIVERKGVKVAFLGYLSVGPNGSMAEEEKPGCTMVRAHTLYEPYEYQPGTPPRILTWAYKEDMEKMVEDIKKAKQQADIVIMTDHWGIHNAPAVIPDYGYEIGHAAIDAGADLVLGTHPHILKAIEVYKGKVIAHSLANFVFETGYARKEGEVRYFRVKSWFETMEKIYRPRHPDQSKTLILKCYISGKKIERVSYLPVQLDEAWANPEPLPRSDPRAQEIYQYMVDITRGAGLDTKYSWKEDEVVIGL